VDPTLPRLTRLEGAVAFDDGRGHGVSAGYESLLDDGTDRQRSPIDLLFGARAPLGAPEARRITGAAFWDFGPVGLRYGVQLWERLVGVAPDQVSVLALGQHALTVSLTPACDCWRVDLSVTQTLKADNKTLEVPSVGASFTVSRFGSIIGTR
jgi:hypothetical protein